MWPGAIEWLWSEKKNWNMVWTDDDSQDEQHCIASTIGNQVLGMLKPTKDDKGRTDGQHDFFDKTTAHVEQQAAVEKRTLLSLLINGAEHKKK